MSRLARANARPAPRRARSIVAPRLADPRRSTTSQTTLHSHRLHNNTTKTHVAEC